MRRTLLLTAALVVFAGCRAQLTLDECKRLAHDNYPAIRQYGLIEQSRQYTVSNAARGWLPQVSATGGAAFYTDIASLPTAATALTGDMKNELYGVSVTVSQTIYDGGTISARQRTVRAQADVSRAQTDVTLYALNSRVEQLFFGVLTIDEQLRQTALLAHDLDLSLGTVTGMMRSGVANQGDVDAVRVEQVRVRQREETLKALRRAYVGMLSTFTGRQLGDSTAFARPDIEAVPATGCHRPELAFYSARNRLLDEQRRSLDAGLMPRLSAFGMGAYHSKPLSVMKNSLLAGGLTLTWNIGALYTRKNDLRSIETERQMNDASRDAFLFNTALESRQSNGVIESLRRQIALDDDIIGLRESIREKSEKKVMGGTETVNEMLRDINAVSEARSEKAQHELRLLQEIYNLRTINNN